MAASLDLDQLRTFVTIAETGSFTRAADVVFKTQSAVSMQMRRLEERIGKPIFARDGRASRLTEEGERLLGYARRMVRLADETVAAFDDTELSGSVRLGTPDDYADRFLPEVLARFSRSNPRVEVSVTCEPSPELIRQARKGRSRPRHRHQLRRGPRRGGAPRAAAVGRFRPARGRRPGDPAAGAVQAAVHVARRGDWRADRRRTALPGALPERQLDGDLGCGACRPRRLDCCRSWRSAAACASWGRRKGCPRLPNCEIGIIRSPRRAATPIVEALAEHIVSSLDNISVPAAAE